MELSSCFESGFILSLTLRVIFDTNFNINLNLLLITYNFRIFLLHFKLHLDHSLLCYNYFL